MRLADRLSEKLSKRIGRQQAYRVLAVGIPATLVVALVLLQLVKACSAAIVGSVV